MFHSKNSHARFEVSTQDVLAPFAVLFMCNVIVLICWTVIDPLSYTRSIGDGTDFWNREIKSYGSCQSDKALAFLTPLAVINFAIFAIACWQAFEARHVESKFAELKYIGLLVASLFQAFLVALPILSIVKDEPRTFYLFLVLTVFIVSEAIPLLIFLPKMLLAREYSGITKSEQKKAMSEQIRQSSRSLSTSRLDSSESRQASSCFLTQRVALAVAMADVPEELGGEEAAQPLPAANQEVEDSSP